MEVQYEQLGLVTELYCKSALSSHGLDRIVRWVAPAIKHRQIKFAFDDAGVPVAYWAWAWLAEDVEQRVISDPNVNLHLSEWNEGLNLWIVDMVVINGYLTDVVRHLHSVQFPDATSVYWVRRRPNGLIRSLSTWRRKNTPSAAASSGHQLIYRLPDTAFADSKTVWRSAFDYPKE